MNSRAATPTLHDMNDHYPEFHEFLTESVVKPFYLRRLEGLQNIRLQEVLKRKNPYLFKAKNLDTPEQLARGVVDAFLSSQEETVFGDLMEGFAIYVAATLWDGFKSKRVGLDLEFERDGKYHIVEIKSGVNWGNSSQIKRMKGSFKAARVALRPEMDAEIIAVNGCIYGKDARPLKADAQDADQTYFKYAGQEFWAFLSGDENLFREIIKPIDEEAPRERCGLQTRLHRENKRVEPVSGT